MLIIIFLFLTLLWFISLYSNQYQYSPWKHVDNKKNTKGSRTGKTYILRDPPQKESMSNELNIKFILLFSRIAKDYRQHWNGLCPPHSHPFIHIIPFLAILSRLFRNKVGRRNSHRCGGRVAGSHSLPPRTKVCPWQLRSFPRSPFPIRHVHLPHSPLPWRHTEASV